ncbi:MAG: hypothetical protein ABI608_06070 [Rhizomicrobium sp.]
MPKQQKYAEFQYDGELCAGHLLVWTWRKLVVGHDHCPVLTREYERFAGPQADALLSAFADFLLALGKASRRMLSVGQPYCAGLTADEERMLRLIAAAQTGDAVLLWAHLAWLARREYQDDVRLAANRLADALRDAGVILPPVRTALPNTSAVLEVVRAHSRM